MISEKTARKRAVRFFEEHKCPQLARITEEGDCVEAVLGRAVRTLGKRRVRELWAYLPGQLKDYVLLSIELPSNQRLRDKFDKLYDEYWRVFDATRPERVKGFSECIDKARKIVENYLEIRGN